MDVKFEQVTITMSSADFEMLRDTLEEVLDDTDNEEFHATHTIDNIHYFWKTLKASK